jgi:hypothetical protein
MSKCLAKDRNNNPCRNSATKDRFCRYHDYMIDYTPEMLQSIKSCSNCKKMYYLGDYNTCEKCRSRGQENRKESRETSVKCSKEGCKFKKSDENNYCGKHQLDYYLEKTEKNGMIPCSNYRFKNCRNPLPKDYKFKRCDECREKEREYDHATRGAAAEEPKIEGMKTCSVCCKSFTIDMFNGLKYETKTCKKCRDAFKIADEKRDKEYVKKLEQENDNKPYNKFMKYKDRCTEKNINFELKLETFTNLIFEKCYYCGVKDNINNKHNIEGINGIDRVNPKIGYTVDNCVSCCKICNYMKRVHSIDNFLKIVEHIGTFNQLFEGKMYPELFKSCGQSYNTYKLSAKQRGYEFNITEELFNSTTKMCCYLCGHYDEKLRNGIDRFNNSIGYLDNNIKPCCNVCNLMKYKYSFDELMNKIKLIYVNRILKTEIKLIDTKNIVIGEDKKEENIVINIITEAKTDTEIIDKKEEIKLETKKNNVENKEDEIKKKREYERLKKQKQREKLKEKLGKEEYDKIQAKKMADYREKKNNN